MVEVKGGREFIERIEYGSDLLTSLENLAKERGVGAGILMAIGAVQRARFRYYDQKEKKYVTIQVDEPMEILSCIGNISTFKENVVIHCHIVLANRDGKVVGGHLDYGTVVFSCEVYLREFKDVELKRKYDQVTGLNLLDI